MLSHLACSLLAPAPPSLQVVGFSGTNDNHRLLPLQVRQHLEVEQSLKATNGKMLALLLENPCYDTLEVKVSNWEGRGEGGGKAWRQGQLIRNRDAKERQATARVG